jgi:hypothetical protein
MSDAQLYATVVDQVHHGTSYYVAMRDVLHDHHFASASLFNWRPPLLYILLGHLPGTIPVWVYFAEVWSGFLLLGAVMVSHRSVRLMGIFALLAVLTRELALPGVLVLAWWTRHEWKMWLSIFAMIGLYYGVHWLLVARMQTPFDVVGPSWLTFGGVRFVMDSMALSPTAVFWPSLGPVLWLLFVAFAMLSSRVMAPARVMLAVYLGLFCCIGLPLNATYWGCLMLPTQTYAIGQWVTRTWLS